MRRYDHPVPSDLLELVSGWSVIQHTGTAGFQSILFETTEQRAKLDQCQEPPFFPDLNLDQLVEAITRGREEYDLKPFFYAALPDVEQVNYRQDVLRDLERAEVSAGVRSFSVSMRTVRTYRAQAKKLYYKYQKEWWLLESVDVYCASVTSLARQLRSSELKSRGLIAFRDYLSGYLESDFFKALTNQVADLREKLATVQYCVRIKGSQVKVSRYDNEPDYSSEVDKTFAKFKQGKVKDRRVEFPDWPEMNHVEASVLDRVARLYPAVFRALDSFCARYADSLDSRIKLFDREVQFYVAYLDFIEPLKAAGLQFCYPRLSARSKEICASEAFDIALAHKLSQEDSRIVCNDFYLRGVERILVVSGPNQGGKTTFARAFGQMHYLASLGFVVPGADARLFLPDQIYTHFEQEEDLDTLHGKLEDELARIHGILRDATTNSIIVLNESFTSTTLRDALLISNNVLRRIVDLDLLCVCVTFLDELSTLSDSVVSMVSTITPGEPASRTFKIVRKSADGLAYALAIADKYGLTYESLRRRLAL